MFLLLKKILISNNPQKEQIENPSQIMTQKKALPMKGKARFSKHVFRPVKPNQRLNPFNGLAKAFGCA
jgi:hypothetical protein